MLSDFAKNLSDTRKRERLTQKELAEKVGCSPAAIGWYERGEKVPTLETASKIADALGVSLDWLWGRDEGVSIPVTSGTWGTLLYLLATWTDSSLQPNIESKTFVCERVDDKTVNILREYDPRKETIKPPLFLAKDVRLVFPPCVLGEIVEYWKKLLDLYRNGTIDRDMYFAWIERKAKEYDDKARRKKENATEE